MMRSLKWLGSALLAAGLAACGGGGGSPGDTNTGPNSPTATPTITMQLVDAQGATVGSVTSSPASFVRATVNDVNGTPARGVVVTFTAEGNLVSFVPSSGSALTDANGVATIQVTPAPGTVGGAAVVRADATVGTRAARQGTLGIQVGGAGSSTPASVEIFASSSQLSSAANSTVSFTVVAKDSQNRAMPNQTVTFSASSGELVGALPARATGPAGEPVTGVSLSTGADRSNRDIVVTATAGGVTQTTTVTVTGTTLTLSGDSSVLLAGSLPFTAVARDSSGQPIANATLTLTSALGNTLTPATVTTDSTGTAKFNYRAVNAGVDTITVRGLGTTTTWAVAVSAEDFAFELPAANTAVPIGAQQIVTVRLLSGGRPVAGRAVTFSTTRGSLSVDNAVTDANGRASTQLTSSTSGPGNLVARAGSAQTVLPVAFVATTPATLVLQANPGAVAPNSGNSTTNQATLQATVRDASGNPVAGRVVNFSTTFDQSNGTIAPGSSVTDTNGIATVQFIPGALSTPNNGVRLQATVQGTTVTGTALLTVNAQALFISIGRGRLLGQSSDPIYRKEFSVYVTDANGAPATNRAVTLSVLPTQYYKGFQQLGFDAAGGARWVQVFTSPACANEDRDRSGILNPGEDVNGNGKLDPGLPVVVTPASVTTDSGGFATFFLQYGKNFAEWVDVLITARAAVGGTESVQTQDFMLQVLADDVTDPEVSPPNQRSPFGTAGECANPN